MAFDHGVESPKQMLRLLMIYRHQFQEVQPFAFKKIISTKRKTEYCIGKKKNKVIQAL